MKRSNTPTDPLATPEMPVQRFGAGMAAKVLEMDRWRLQKFLSSPRYRLAPSESILGEERTRRVFTEIDILRLGVAGHLVRDGFAAPLVGQIVEQIEDEELLGTDRFGHSIRYGLALSRGEKGPRADVFLWNDRKVFTTKSRPYYVLNLSELMEVLTQKMHALTVGRKASTPQAKSRTGEGTRAEKTKVRESRT